MTTLSRISGLVRDVCIANIFGAGTGSDAFFVAFKIPNYLRRLFAEGGFSQAFVPVLSEYKVNVTWLKYGIYWITPAANCLWCFFISP